MPPGVVRVDGSGGMRGSFSPPRLRAANGLGRAGATVLEDEAGVERCAVVPDVTAGPSTALDADAVPLDADDEPVDVPAPPAAHPASSTTDAADTADADHDLVPRAPICRTLRVACDACRRSRQHRPARRDVSNPGTLMRPHPARPNVDGAAELASQPAIAPGHAHTTAYSREETLAKGERHG